MTAPFVEITCPHCWQRFTIPGPAPRETPTSWDYDCEICCRPMMIHFALEDDAVIADAEGLEDG